MIKNIYLVAFCLVMNGAHAVTIGDLAFLRGCWGVTAPNGQTLSEDWSKGNDDAMLGISLTSDAQNKTVETAFFEIRKAAGSGEIHFTPYLNGRSLGPYLMTEQTSAGVRRRAVFTNLQNKYLSQFVYSGTFPEATSLTIELKGEDRGGQPYAYRFELAAEDCADRY